MSRSMGYSWTLCVILYICLLSVVSSQDYLCPRMLKKVLGGENSCEKVKCATNIEQKNCPENTILTQHVTSCGCCPGCVKYVDVGEGEVCNEASYETCNDKICPVKRTQCSPGLVCDKESGRCTAVNEPKEELTCADKLALARADRLHWTPYCNPDGSYAPRQCKGTKSNSGSMCFCTNREGKRIFGRRYWNDATEEEMNCACSLQAYELRQKGLISTLHCTYDGSYEELQCDTDSGLCYCVNSTTGALTGAVLPENMWRELPCYNQTLMGDNYYRQCDSQWAAVQRIKREAQLHGLPLDKFNEYFCDYDGSFSKYQLQTESVTQREVCVYKNGKQIESYYRSYDGSREPMDCNCARDPSDFELEGIAYRSQFACEREGKGVGNYARVQISSGRAVCVDSDGFSYYDEAPASHLCCLTGECSTDLQKDCYDAETNPTGYKRCDTIVH